MNSTQSTTTAAPASSQNGDNQQELSQPDDDERQKLLEWKRKRQARQRRHIQEDDEQRGSGHNAVSLMGLDSRTGTRPQLTREDSYSPRIDSFDRQNKVHFDEGNDDDDNMEVMTAAKRLKLQQQAVLQLQSTSLKVVGRRKHVLQSLQQQQATTNNRPNTGGPFDYSNPSTRQQQSENGDAPTSRQDNDKDGSDMPQGNYEGEDAVVESLLDQAAALQGTMTEDDRLAAARQLEETRLLREAANIQTNALQAAKQVAAGIQYTEPMPSTWRPPRYLVEQGMDAWNAVRREWHMQIQGRDVPPPVKNFADLKLPPPVMAVLREKKMERPTPIQMQGLPVALAGRDMVGIAFTGSGKTLTFTVPLVMWALEEELRMPLIRGEGPVGIILSPSRELARQTADLVQQFCTSISSWRPEAYPTVHSQLLIGGESLHDQLHILHQGPLHCVVATPGRLRDVLKRKAMHMDVCRYICLDEADRMLDMGFDQEVAEIMNHMPHQHQTVLFSATFPQKFQDFARSTLVLPIIVNVGRAGAANLDVIQEVEYVKEESKIVYILHCLQKTAPPVMIFCQRKGDADDIHEYLLLKGVSAACVHGDKDQADRVAAMEQFKAGQADVLIATDIAAKGLDFPAIQHVINFDFPAEIEHYVHRIGRTGRAGKTGVATTFINKSCDETALLDLKALLQEAKQRVPPVLQMLEDPRAANATAGGCSFCGGLGHSVVDCPKIDKDARRVAGNRRDVLASGGGGGDW